MNLRGESFPGPFRTSHDVFNEDRALYLERGFKVVELPTNFKKGDFVKDLTPSMIGGLVDKLLAENSAANFLSKAEHTVLVFGGSFFEPARAQYPSHRIRDLGFSWFLRQQDRKTDKKVLYIHINDLGEIIDIKRD